MVVDYLFFSFPFLLEEKKRRPVRDEAAKIEMRLRKEKRTDGSLEEGAIHITSCKSQA